MRLFFLLFALTITLFTTASCKKSGDNKAPECKSPSKPAKTQVTVPKRWTSRTILEMQIRLGRALKIQDWEKLDKWLMGGLIKSNCPAKGLSYNWKKCLGDMHTQSNVIKSKQLTKCPSGKIPSWSSPKCPVKAWCESITLTYENKDKKQVTVIFKDLAKVAGKWWALGPVSCEKVP